MTHANVVPTGFLYKISELRQEAKAGGRNCRAR
jgi:hypothetical protein